MSANDDPGFIVRLAWAWSVATLQKYQAAERPEQYAAFERAVMAGAVRFDLAVRDVNGFAPTLELIAVVGDAEKVIGSQVLRKRGS